MNRRHREGEAGRQVRLRKEAPTMGMLRSLAGGLLRGSLRNVPVPALWCLLVLVLLLIVNTQVRHIHRAARLAEAGGGTAELGGGGRGAEVHHLRKDFQSSGSASQLSKDSARSEAMARVEKALSGGEEGEVGRGEGRSQRGVYPPRPAVVDFTKQQPRLQEQPPVKHRQEKEDGEISEGELEALAQILEMRLSQIPGGVYDQRTCGTLKALNNSRGPCVDTTCPHTFPPSARARIRPLLAPHFRMTARQRALVEEMGKEVAPRKYLFVTAASSNHFHESQALVHNMRQFIFPKLSNQSYSFLYFDLGLKAWERQRVEKNCNCTVVKLNVKLLPRHARHLMCYAWKPIIIKALLPKTQVLVYMDASVRFRSMDLDEFFASAKRWGAQFLASKDSIPNHTVQSTFDFYQQPPCLFWPFPELLAGFSVFHNEPFMTRVVLEPWVSCAFNTSCMCPVDPHAYRICPHVERRVGQCHRFDLSALTLQMGGLYGDRFYHLVMQGRTRPAIVRNDKMDFFTD